MAKILFYQIYLIAWTAFGGIKAATEYLPRLKELGVDVVWIGPIFESPWFDHGYDIANFFAVDPRLGTIDELKEFIETAHMLGIKVIVDLVLNHTSTEHEWFKNPKTRKKFYSWSKRNRIGWKNLFDGGSCWEYCAEEGAYYCHLFHKKQADLNWFPNGPQGPINEELVNEFNQVILFWLKFGVDGFRLDVPQSVNKDYASQDLRFKNLLGGNQAIRVINTLFKGVDCLLLMECFDPTEDGKIIQKYLKYTPVDYIMNVMLKDRIITKHGIDLRPLGQAVKIPGYVISLEDHDSPRFCSRNKLLRPEDALGWILQPNARAVMLFQGQEYGLSNPSKKDLPDELMCELDAKSHMLHTAQGVNLDAIRPISRANGRWLPVPLSKLYDLQKEEPFSSFNYALALIKFWRSQ